jgi:hydrogenase maturation protein HypF
MTTAGEAIRVRGLVQGVGFRPAVWRLASELGLDGDVRNDAEGVLIRVWGSASRRDELCRRLYAECPPLARIAGVDRSALAATPPVQGFRIVASAGGEVRTGIVPDAATCEACRRELFDPGDRRFRYPFINCTHCGPRLSIVRAIPYDRPNTSMAAFRMCPDCAREYGDPADRRFHAQPDACAACGPRVWLEDAGGRVLDPSAAGARDAIELASRRLREGRVLAVKGIGGFHLACDATDAAAVASLRERKRRYGKPFGLMARSLDVIGRYCQIDPQEAAALLSPAAPIVLLDATGPQRLPAGVAPGQCTLGFMLPYSPIHHLLLEGWDTPLVMTSGNLSEEPQCTDNADAGHRLRGLADLFLLHDREIVNRVDDSVVRRMDGRVVPLRRARGFAPVPMALPPGLQTAPPLLAFGGELKATACLVTGGEAILTQHLGDLEDARTFAEYERTVGLYGQLYEHRPQCLVADLHPDYRSTRFAKEWARRQSLPLFFVQHHHAHIAAVMADNGWSPNDGAVLGVALDGLGYGDDGTLWGGELLLANYLRYERLARLAPAAMPGGMKAILEPWRNTVAQLALHVGWDAFRRDWAGLELARYLAEKPADTLLAMIARGINAPASSSCGRLFDAVAAAVGLCPDRVSYEGQAAMELEASIGSAGEAVSGYPFGVRRGGGIVELDPASMWRELLADLGADRAAGHLAARFHAGLADAVAGLAAELARSHGVAAVALSGGVFQNRTLLEATARRLREAGLAVLTHREVPANDGGLSLGQAVVAAARRMHDARGACNRA